MMKVAFLLREEWICLIWRTTAEEDKNDVSRECCGYCEWGEGNVHFSRFIIRTKKKNIVLV